MTEKYNSNENLNEENEIENEHPINLFSTNDAIDTIKVFDSNV